MKTKYDVIYDLKDRKWIDKSLSNNHGSYILVEDFIVKDRYHNASNVSWVTKKEYENYLLKDMTNGRLYFVTDTEELLNA